jgi:hypothetical protein
MVKYIFIVVWWLAVSPLNAQQMNQPRQLTHYVLDSFYRGKVQVKTGVVSAQTLNYNILTNEMIFEEGGRMMAIGNPENVDTVFIKGRKFIPAEGKFYEVLSNNKLPLLLEFTSTVDEPSASAGYGNASGATNVTSISTLVKSGDVYALKLPDDFKVIPGFIFRILKNGKYLKAGNEKQLIVIFPDKKDRIKELVKKNNTNFSERSDLIKLVEEIQE